MYGETEEDDEILDPTAGLSPHVRGNRSVRLPPAARTGSIPACTGKPVDLQSFDHLPQVYPRMYGETGREESENLMAKGLSPHVRGNRGGGRGAD